MQPVNTIIFSEGRLEYYVLRGETAKYLGDKQHGGDTQPQWQGACVSITKEQRKLSLDLESNPLVVKTKLVF